jgi:formate-dependent nitrite reductase membrane component NrfD
MPGEHFVVPPHWEWYILGYFFFAGISGGSFVLGTMLRLWGDERDAGTSRAAFLISFPTLIVCPILLTLDLGQPLRFWHFLINDSGGGLAFKSWSPMSLGAWGLLIFGIFSFVMFLAALAERDTARFSALRPAASFAAGAIGRVFMVVGAVVGLFIAAYTGVLLAVSNQPVWSDTWALGGLFLASALSGSAASVLLATRNRRDAMVTDRKLIEADRYFILLELALIVLFLATLGGVVSKVLSGGWILLWVVVLVGTLIPLALHWRATRTRATVPAVGTAAADISLLAPVLVLLGVLALRAVVIFSAQA